MSDTPRTDALIQADKRNGIHGYMAVSAYDRIAGLALDLERDLDACKKLMIECLADRNVRIHELERELASLRSQNETMGKLYAAQSDRMKDRLDNITDRDLSPDRRTLANYWEARFHAAWRETANANRGIARLLRRLEGAQERIASLQSDAAMLREENARLHARLITTNLDC